MKRLTMIGIVSLIMGLALFALTLGPAEAGGPRVLVGPTPWKGQTWQFHQQRPHVTDTPPASVTLPRHAFPVQPRPPIFVPGFPNRPSYPFLSYGYGCCVYSARLPHAVKIIHRLCSSATTRTAFGRAPTV